jgi:hypothetical protein
MKKMDSDSISIKVAAVPESKDELSRILSNIPISKREGKVYDLDINKYI